MLEKENSTICPICFFAYTAFNLVKNYGNIEKYIIVGKTFAKAKFQEQFQLSSSICLEVKLV